MNHTYEIRLIGGNGTLLSHKGKIKISDQVVYCYGEDEEISCIVPIKQVRYIRRIGEKY